jgi:cyclophilin family peptidyl-prolyl cis-trans isomerase
VRRLALLLLPLAVLAGACGSGSKPTASATTTSGPASGFRYGTGACPPATPPAQTPRTFAAAPRRCIDTGKDYGAVIATSEGTFTVDLAERTAPGTVNNFVVLARWGWFDGDDFHRVVPGFVAQAGDRFGDPQGTGGPGYTIPDELPKTPYVKGSLAMANTGAPDSAGSQWFVCEDCSSLPLQYATFGTVTAGLDVVDRIMALGVSDGPPSKPIAITKVTITER